MVEVVKKAAESLGESFELREYERMTGLEVSPPPAKGLAEVKEGDCVVAFSRKAIYDIKRSIESSTKLKCCVIYGALPPEARRVQAGLFNDPDSGWDVLVASDAVGMGLNLNIRRVLFHSLMKQGEEFAIEVGCYIRGGDTWISPV